ncbi:MAG: hypothetical protein H8F28_00585 [Fibrella sp.]|nr:hypothetical protein [Armatimonadota bacterium]
MTIKTTILVLLAGISVTSCATGCAKARKEQAQVPQNQNQVQNAVKGYNPPPDPGEPKK